MELKWYWPMEILGLVKDLTAEYGDGSTYYEVSVHCDTVMRYLLLSLIPALFLLGLLIRWLCRRAGHDTSGQRIVRSGTILLCLYAILLAVGIGPYVMLYPQGGGFLNFDTLAHILKGVYCALLALMLYLGGGRNSQSQS